MTDKSHNSLIKSIYLQQASCKERTVCPPFTLGSDFGVAHLGRYLSAFAEFFDDPGGDGQGVGGAGEQLVMGAVEVIDGNI